MSWLWRDEIRGVDGPGVEAESQDGMYDVMRIERTMPCNA